MTPKTPTIVGPTAGIDVLTSDIKAIETLLRNGRTTSRFLVEAYLAQIEKHDDYLHAMIQITPKKLLFERADSLDKEREAGKECGPLYGIPIIVKVSSENGMTYRFRISLANRSRIHWLPIPHLDWEPQPAVCHSWVPNLGKTAKLLKWCDQIPIGDSILSHRNSLTASAARFRCHNSGQSKSQCKFYHRRICVHELPTDT